jgi:hypothetical protein
VYDKREMNGPMDDRPMNGETDDRFARTTAFGSDDGRLNGQMEDDTFALGSPSRLWRDGEDGRNG